MFDLEDESVAAHQIQWEYTNLNRADVILFWFDQGQSVQPITLYELGRYSALGKKIAVGTHPDYIRRFDVVEQMRHAHPMVTVREGLAHTCDDAIRLLPKRVGFEACWKRLVWPDGMKVQHCRMPKGHEGKCAYV